MTPEVQARFDRLERLLERLVDRQTAKEWYTVGEFARLAGKAPFTVRQWCNRGRVRAARTKTRTGPRLGDQPRRVPAVPAGGAPAGRPRRLVLRAAKGSKLGREKRVSDDGKRSGRPDRD